jgi:putative membrane protein (TIGR04086 family)
MVVTVPAAVLGERTADGADDPSNLVFLWFAVVLAGFVLGGWLAARTAPAAPFSNGAVAALVAYALVQGVGVVLLLARDEPLRPAQLAFNALVAYASGLLGGLLGSRRLARR